MTYPYGGLGQYPTRSSSAYGGYWPQPPAAPSRRALLATQLLWVVLLLGLTTYFVSYAAAAPSGMGWGVRFSTLAAIVGALGLLPRQSAHTKLMAALATTGFLDALSQLITGDQQHPAWATIVIPVLIALQALTAIAILLARLREAADREPAPYDPYSYYAHAARQYYATQNQQPQQRPVQVDGKAQAEAAATADAAAQAPQQSAAEGYALYAEYLSAEQPGVGLTARSAAAGGRMRTGQPASGSGMLRTGPVENTRLGNEPAAESPTQSFS